jgi:transcription-repair coupling factor (superfamily II helicase)
LLNIKPLLKNKIINLTPIIEGCEFYAIATIANETKNNIIYIARDEQRANAIFTACTWFITNRKILHLPAWDSIPYDLTSPSSYILAKRIGVFTEIAQNPSLPKIIITSANAAIQKIPTQQEINKAILAIKIGQKYNRDILIKYLINHNYIRTTTANSIGEFAVRGSIIDIITNNDGGYRLDFFGDVIENIKIFDAESQLSTAKIDKILITPPSELILSEVTIEKFKQNLISKYGANATASDAMQNIARGNWHFTGVEQWLPLFYDKLTSLFDFVGSEDIVMFDYLAKQAVAEQFEEIKRCYDERKLEIKIDKKLYSDPLPPNALFLDDKELENSIQNSTQIHCLATDNGNSNTKIKLNIKPNENLLHLAQLEKVSTLEILKRIVNKNFVISALSNGSRERVERIFHDHEISFTKHDGWDYQTTMSAKTAILVVSPLDKGFTTENFTLITEQEIFGVKIQNSNIKKHKSFQKLIQEVNNFVSGEIVVHIDHGIGRFEGLETVALSTTKHDCFKILYDGGDILYVPVENIEVISKYGVEGDVRLDKLSSASWQSRKAKLKNRIKLSAEYLLKIAAERLSRKCDVIIPNVGVYDEFCATFPYQETDDQLSSIEVIKNDLASGIPMDRLVCGDVGFGKTEVAIRAAFITLKASDNVKRQVAVICPTTLLCNQHFKVFAERFKDFNINIKQLSRFVSKKEAAQTIDGINLGKVDIVVSTHALLNEKIQFNNLALLIVDEEQHFGVIQKEKLKEKKANVHVLSLSATPIPRTLQMSLTGIKDLSIIATPPINRLVTKTSVLAYDSIIIKEAMLREFHRGGQIFYVCPRISDMSDVIDIVSSLAPELKIVSAHGQMPPTKLENAIHDFENRKYDVLISTSIIESGLDMSNVNTIIIHRSDKFGLSQLYQLRGRVGRSKNKAYAYFTIPNKNLLPNVIRRLEILQNIDSLGAGFSVASHDMDIRGFGNLLGDEQSGHIREVGIELYQEMLQQTLKTLKCDNGVELNEKWTPQINLGLSVLIPENYIQDLELRLNLYQRIATLEHENEIESFAAEMIDRFGSLPEEFEHLITIVKLKKLCLQNNIRKIDAGPKAIMFEFSKNSLDKADKIMALATNNPAQIKIRPDNKVLLNISLDDPNKRVSIINKFIGQLR